MKDYNLFNVMGWSYGFDASQLVTYLEEEAQEMPLWDQTETAVNPTSNTRFILITAVLFLLFTIPAFWVILNA